MYKQQVPVHRIEYGKCSNDTCMKCHKLEKLCILLSHLFLMGIEVHFYVEDQQVIVNSRSLPQHPGIKQVNTGYTIFVFFFFLRFTKMSYGIH